MISHYCLLAAFICLIFGLILLFARVVSSLLFSALIGAMTRIEIDFFETEMDNSYKLIKVFFWLMLILTILGFLL
jgi:hypothetical protein